MQPTLHATRPTPHSASRLVQAMPAWSVKTRCVPSMYYREARVYVKPYYYGHAVHEYTSLPLSPSLHRFTPPATKRRPPVGPLRLQPPTGAARQGIGRPLRLLGVHRNTRWGSARAACASRLASFPTEPSRGCCRFARERTAAPGRSARKGGASAPNTGAVARRTRAAFLVLLELIVLVLVPALVLVLVFALVFVLVLVLVVLMLLALRFSLPSAPPGRCCRREIHWRW